MNSSDRLIEVVARGGLALVADAGDQSAAVIALAARAAEFEVQRIEQLTGSQCQLLLDAELIASIDARAGTSIDARAGAGDPGSAADRARTMRLAASGRATPGAFIRPGHVPVVAIAASGAARFALELARDGNLCGALVIAGVNGPDGRPIELHELPDHPELNHLPFALRAPQPRAEPVDELVGQLAWRGSAAPVVPVGSIGTTNASQPASSGSLATNSSSR